jgi:tetratricopeptide (TPR) repeat protein
MDPDETVFKKGTDSYKVLRLADLKKELRCITKTVNEYSGNAARLCDVGRATIICKTEKQVAKVYRALKRKADVVRNKNRFVTPTDSGIRDMVVNIRVNGHIFEVQIHQADLLAETIESNGHEYYDFFRITFAGNRKTYKKRMEIFMKLGLNAQTGKSVARAILEGENKIKLRVLGDLSSERKFDTPDLSLLVWTRLLELSKDSSDAKRINLMTKIGYAYYRQGNYEKAMDVYEQALSNAKNSTRCFQIETAKILNNMALVLYSQGKHEEALEIYNQILIADSSISMSLVKTYRLMNALAIKSKKLRNYGEAVKIFDRIYHGKEFISLLVSDDPFTLKAKNNMADVYVMVGKYEQAMDIYEHVLKIRKANLGIDDPDTLETMNSLAHVYFVQRRLTKAMKMYEQVLERKQKRLGIDHPRTLKTESDIADLHSMQRKYGKAIGIYEKVFERRKAVLGIDHPDTLTTMNNMADAYSKQGDNRKAMEIYKKVLFGRTSALGINHPNTLVTMHNLARLYSKQGRYEGALALYETMLSARKPALGMDQYERMEPMRNRALLYMQGENFADAVKIYEQMIIRKRVTSLRDSHLQALSTVRLLSEERI